ncbi:universal stress protein [Streptomyces boninensis]|uniref:universal stress protein n=1 Tax=Streptomyces boninensis TaxID=2039455 RepID=UPI003B21C393
MSAPILVGVDGTDSSLQAVATAVREAQLRGCGVRVIHAFIWPLMGVPLGASPIGPVDGGLSAEGERIVAAAVEHARGVGPEVPVEGAVVTGDASPVLVAESRSAALVVVGSRGLGAFTGLLVGSTAIHLAAHAECPVLVVRGRAEPQGPVVLGTDGSPAAEPAVAFAFNEASLRGTRLIAVHAWTPWNATLPPPQDPALPYAGRPGDLPQAEERLLAEAVAGHQDRYPDVEVELRTVESGTREALIEASREAQLLVVGARGRGGFKGLLLGSTSQALMQHADCPIVIVRNP